MKLGKTKIFRLKHNKKHSFDSAVEMLRNVDWVKIISTTATFVVLVFVLYHFYLPNDISWKTGDVADKEIIAKSNVTYRDLYSEKLLRNQISTNEMIYDVVPDAQSNTNSDINLIFTAIAAEKNDDGSPSSEKIDRLHLAILKYSSGQLSDKTIYTLLTIPESDFHQVKEAALVTATIILSGEVRENLYFMKQTYKEVKKLSDEKFRRQPELAEICYDVIVSVLKPNRIYNEEKTIELANERKKNIKPIYKTIYVGDKVVGADERVTEGTIAALKALRIYSGTGSTEKLIYVVLFILTIFIVTAFFIVKVCGITDRKKILLINIVITISMLFFYVSGCMFENYFSQLYIGYLGTMWVVAAAMLIYILCDHRFASVFLVAMSVLLGYIFGDNIRVLAVSLVTGICAIYSLRTIKNRSDIITIYLIIALATLLQIVLYDLLINEGTKKIVFDIMWSVLIIPISTFVLVVTSSILEKLFDITTPMRLVELSDTNLPLLRHLALEAPGTYAHSVSVANLGEIAANEIGADALMVRVGAYYHDIGKLNQPDYFSENQFGYNIHNDLTPSLSSMVIQMHVKNGIEIADEYKLPSVVKELIAQHHGTTIVSYFYNKFTVGYDGDAGIIEEHFRYGGPKPQTKEAAVLMLADSCEAASRSLKKPNLSQIEALVNSVFSGKLADAQFSECPISLKEIGVLKLSIIRTLTHMLHSRVSYSVSDTKEDNIGNNN